MEELGAFQYRENSAGEIKGQADGQRTTEELRNGETKETILEGVGAFTSELLEKYPQVNEEGKLNYYLSGSLAVMLLLKGGRFEIMDETRLPEIVPVAEKEIPPEALKYLEGFVRKIGDLDFVPFDEWKESEKRMKKGGGGPQIADLSETAKKVLKINENQSRVDCDPLKSVTPHRVSRVKINGKEVYISEPKMMFAYKIVHLTQVFDDASKTDKFVSDFNAMLRCMEAIYSREELLRAAYETMFAYAPNFPNNEFIPYHNPKFRGELKRFYDEFLALDADAIYLDQLTYGKERSIGVLKVLHRYQSQEAKSAIVNFINQHRKLIDKWSVNFTSPRNREIIADFLLSHPELLDDFKTQIQGEVTREAIIEALKIHIWAFDKYGSQMPDNSALEMMPQSSIVMDILMEINESNLEQELSDVGYLLENGMNESYMFRILGAKFMTESTKRQQLLRGLKTARATLGNQEFEQLTRMLCIVIADTHYYDSSSNRLIEIKEEERSEKVASVFKQFGIEYDRT